MAWSVNHQSQLRVPPTPRKASLPNFCARGKFKPELTSTVVLPAPGGPMMMYHGSSYRLAPRLDFLSASRASSKRLRNWVESPPEPAVPPDALSSCLETSLTSFWLALALRMERNCT